MTGGATEKTFSCFFTACLIPGSRWCVHGELQAAQTHSISLLSGFAQSLCRPPGGLVIKILEMQTFVRSICTLFGAACHIADSLVAAAAPEEGGLGGGGAGALPTRLSRSSATGRALTTTIRCVYTKAQK